MRFYNVNGELDARQLDRTYGTEVDMILSALDCVLNGDKALYGSSELTTGRRFYELARRHGVQSTGELRQALGQDAFEEQLWNPNVEAANAFARKIRQHHQSQEIVITPAPFIAPGWSQPEYLAFWETLLRTRLKAAWFNEGWQYSSGCTFEFSVAIDAGLPTFDAKGQPLDYETGVAMGREAVKELESKGCETDRLRRYVARLETLTPSQVA